MSSPEVFDKGKYHYGGRFPKGLPRRQGYVHIALYLTWCVTRDLVSERLRQESGALLDEVKARRSPGSKLLEWWDETLSSEMLSDLGAAFTRVYYDLRSGQYIADYSAALCKDLESPYMVMESWENCDVLSEVIDRRFAEFRTQHGSG